MLNTRIVDPRALLAFALILFSPKLFAQDEVRLKDGGVLEGKIIRETETLIELKHESFGVIKIEKDRILSAGAYGTLSTDASTEEPKDEAGRKAAAARRAAAENSPVSRLDLDYKPERFEPLPIPGQSQKLNPSTAGVAEDLRAEMVARPDLAKLYENLINREVIKSEEAELLFALNERWEADPDSLSPLERKIVRTLTGESEPTAREAVGGTRNPPPAELARVVGLIRAKLDEIDEVSYEERFSLTAPEGETVIRYERQVRRPDLIAGTSEVLQHVNPLESNKATRYFGDGQMLWLLTRRGKETGAAFVAQSSDVEGFSSEQREERAREYETPTGTRADYSEWAAAGFSIAEMTRSDLLLRPFDGLDLATLQQVSEDEAYWVFTADIDSPAFEFMERAELQIAKSTGLLESIRMSADSLEAQIEFSRIEPGSNLPASMFVVPQSPEGRSFSAVEAPDSSMEALSMLGAL